MRVSSILAVSLSVVAVSAHGGEYDDSDCSSHLPASSHAASPPHASTPLPELVVDYGATSSPIPSGHYSSQLHPGEETSVPPTPTPTGGDDGYGPPPVEEASTTPIPTPTPTSVSEHDQEVPPEVCIPQNRNQYCRFEANNYHFRRIVVAPLAMLIPPLLRPFALLHGMSFGDNIVDGRNTDT